MEIPIISYLSTHIVIIVLMVLMARLRWPISVIGKQNSLGNTKKPQQNKKPRQAKTTVTQNSHGKIKKSRQNEKAMAKQKKPRQNKNSRQNKKATAK